MPGVCGDDGGLKQDRGSIGAADENVRLAAVTEVFEDVGGSEEIALIIDEEAVAEKAVVVAAGGGGLVELIDDGANGGGGVVGKDLGCAGDREGGEKTADQGCQTDGATLGGLRHLARESLRDTT